MQPEIPEEGSKYMQENREEKHQKCTRKTLTRSYGRLPVALLAGALIMLIFATAPAVALDNEEGMTNPTVIISDYKVTPTVLLPGDEGLVTFTIKNTAQSATVKENSGIVAGGTFESTRSSDINVFVENVHLEGNGVAVLTKDFDRLGEIGPGQSVPVSFMIKAPEKSGIYFPEAWIDVKNGRSTRYPFTVNVNYDVSTQKKPSLAVIQDLPDRVAQGGHLYGPDHYPQQRAHPGQRCCRHG